MLEKYGSAVALMQPTTVDKWNNFKTASQQPELREFVAAVDQDCIYLHGSILASVDLEPNHEYYIKKDSEDFINDNGDAFPRDEVLKRYQTFKTHSRTYSEHKQGPEHAKGRCIDVVIRNLGNTVLVDVLFTVDKAHTELIRNIEKEIVTHLSMGCQTEYTKCSICGHLAHTEDEYCDHIKNNKRQMVLAADGNMRKAAELCFNNTWIDISLVMNPAFGGATIRKILSSDTVGKQVLASILSKYINEEQNFTYEQAMCKVASIAETFLEKAPETVPETIHETVPETIPCINEVKVEIMNPTPCCEDEACIQPIHHPITNDISNNSYPPTGFEDIPWNDPKNIKDDFDKDNPGNESEVEGPIQNLENCSEQSINDTWQCSRCSNKKASIIDDKTSSVVKCLKCSYIHEIDSQKCAEFIVKISNKEVEHIHSIDNVVPNKEEITAFAATNLKPQILIQAEDGTTYDLIEKVANLEKMISYDNYKKAVKEVINILYSYSSVNQLKQATQMLDDFKIDSSVLKQAIQNYDNIDSSEPLIHTALLEIEKLAFNEGNVKTGISLYMEKIYDKWDHRDISELIYELFPYEAKVILDEVRKVHFR